MNVQKKDYYKQFLNCVTKIVLLDGATKPF